MMASMSLRQSEYTHKGRLPKQRPGWKRIALSFTTAPAISGSLGVGFDSTGVVGFLNDLWEFNPTAKMDMDERSSIVGSNPAAQMGIYAHKALPRGKCTAGLQKRWLD